MPSSTQDLGFARLDCRLLIKFFLLLHEHPKKSSSRFALGRECFVLWREYLLKSLSHFALGRIPQLHDAMICYLANELAEIFGTCYAIAHGCVHLQSHPEPAIPGGYQPSEAGGQSELAGAPALNCRMAMVVQEYFQSGSAAFDGMAPSAMVG